MVVFSGKKFNHDLCEGEVPGTLYGMSESGWMDQELFSNWFLHQFLNHAVSRRPILLMLDGHSSHYTLELIQSAAENDVIIFCLPSHTTADRQPLDTSGDRTCQSRALLTWLIIHLFLVTNICALIYQKR